MDINKVFDFDTLLRCFEDLKATGIGYALCYMQHVLIPKEIKDKLLADGELSDRFFCENRIEFLEEKNVWNDTNYKSRIRGLVEDLYVVYDNNT